MLAGRTRPLFRWKSSISEKKEGESLNWLEEREKTGKKRLA